MQGVCMPQLCWFQCVLQIHAILPLQCFNNKAAQHICPGRVRLSLLLSILKPLRPQGSNEYGIAK